MEVFRQHVYGCFIEDVHGVESIEKIGVDNVMLECDFPHADSSWPDTPAVVAAALGPLSPEDRHKIARGNAERVFRLT
jgi:predicted TIM-barrel fold metal-dependent hydrolase